MDATSIIRLAIQIISDRLITVLALIAASIMCGWTMWDPAWQRVATLAIFVVFEYLLVRSKENSNETRSATSASS